MALLPLVPVPNVRGDVSEKYVKEFMDKVREYKEI